MAHQPGVGTDDYVPDSGNNQGVGSRGPRVPPPAAPPAPPAGIDAFLEQLGLVNPQRFGIGQTFIDRGLSGQEDPLIAMRRQQANDQLQAQLGRQGIGGSVGMNQQARLNSGFDQQSLARNDQLLQGGFGLQQSGLQNLLAQPTLDVAQTAAENAGKGGGGGGGKK